MTKKREESSFVSEVLARTQNCKPGFRPWYVNLPAGLREEMEPLRAAYRAGELNRQKKATCIAISQVLAERGVPNISWQMVQRWLDAPS